MNFYSRFGISAGIVFGAMGTPWIGAAFTALVNACRVSLRGQEAGAAPRFGEIFRATWHRVQLTAARYSLIVMLFSHPAISGQTFFFFSCQAIGDTRYVEYTKSIETRAYDSRFKMQGNWRVFYSKVPYLSILI